MRFINVVNILYLKNKVLYRCPYDEFFCITKFLDTHFVPHPHCIKTHNLFECHKFGHVWLRTMIE